MTAMEEVLRDAVHIGHSTGGGEVVRYLARHGDSRTAKAVLVMHGVTFKSYPLRTQALCLRSSCRTQHVRPTRAFPMECPRRRRTRSTPTS
jgi:pimeloyl-ACP methyl ester carboxylesterase